MGETFTLIGFHNQTKMKKSNENENLDGDDLIFYHSLRSDLDLLKKKPKLQTIHYILDHSRSLR